MWGGLFVSKVLLAWSAHSDSRECEAGHQWLAQCDRAQRDARLAGGRHATPSGSVGMASEYVLFRGSSALQTVSPSTGGPQHKGTQSRVPIFARERVPIFAIFWCKGAQTAERLFLFPHSRTPTCKRHAWKSTASQTHTILSHGFRAPPTCPCIALGPKSLSIFCFAQFSFISFFWHVFFLLCFRLLAVMDVEAHTPCSVLFAFQLRTSISGRHVRTCSCRGAPTVTQSDSNL